MKEPGGASGKGKDIGEGLLLRGWVVGAWGWITGRQGAQFTCVSLVGSP